MIKVTQNEMVQEMLDELASKAQKVEMLSAKIKRETEVFMENPWRAAYGSKALSQPFLDLQQVAAKMQVQAFTIRSMMDEEHVEFLNRAAAGDRRAGREYFEAVSSVDA